MLPVPPVRLAVVVLIACLGSACARVRPHEREHLAHPAMRAPVWPGVDRADQHTFTVREGTGGASGGGGAGCGCN